MVVGERLSKVVGWGERQGATPTQQPASSVGREGLPPVPSSRDAEFGL